MLFKKLIYLLVFSFITVAQLFPCEQKKQEEENISSWLGKVGPKDIQGIVCQYLDKWDDNIKQYDAHAKLIRQIAKSPNGKLLASVSDDGFVKLWDISNNQNIRYLDNIKIEAFSLDISPDNKYLAIGSKCKFEIHNIENTENIKLETTAPLDSSGKIKIIKFLDNNFVIVCGDHSGMYIFNIGDLDHVFLANTKKTGFTVGRTLTDSHYYSTCAIAYSSIHKYLATADYDCGIIIWDSSNLPALNKICHFKLSNSSDVMVSLDFYNDDKYLISNIRSCLKILNIENIKEIKSVYEKNISKTLKSDGNFDDYHPAVDIKNNPNSKYLTCLRNDSILTIFDISNLEKIKSYDLGQKFQEDTNACIGSLVFSNDGSSIIFAGNNRKINVVSNLAMLLKTKNALTFDRYCKSCNKTDSEVSKLLICSRCHNVRYCNATCQRNDWQNHKDNCK